MEKEVVWTDLAKNDLQDIYDFISNTQSEQKGFETVKNLTYLGRILEKKFVAGSRYESKIDPFKNYQKLIWKHYLIIFRKEGEIVFINRVFDSRQNPDKLTL